MKAEVIDANSEMNLQIYDTFPKKLFSSFIVIGGLIVAMAVALAGSTSTLCCELGNPRISQRTL